MPQALISRTVQLTQDEWQMIEDYKHDKKLKSWSKAFLAMLAEMRAWQGAEGDKEMNEVVERQMTCLKCGADWDGGEIPEDIRQHYSPPYRWSRRIGISSIELDRVVAYRCPDCGDEVTV